MKAQCPNCKTLYNINDSKIPGKGAHVTCPKCQTRFEVKRPIPAPGHAQKKDSDEHIIITCPSCGHVNLSTDKCHECGYIFSEEDKKNLVINI